MEIELIKCLMRYSYKKSAKHPAVAEIIDSYKLKPRTEQRSHEVVVVGQTGYGKSALLRALTGYPYQSSHVAACTRYAESVEFTLSEGQCDATLAFIDLPGVGESPEADARSYELYREVLSTATVILFVLRADKRDHSVDLCLFKRLRLISSAELLFVITAVDKIEPLNRTPGPMLTSAQEQNLKHKILSIADMFQVGISSVRCVSVEFQQGIVGLMKVITQLIL